MSPLLNLKKFNSSQYNNADKGIISYILMLYTVLIIILYIILKYNFRNIAL